MLPARGNVAIQRDARGMHQNKGMDLEYLKQATRPEHEGTESTVPLMSAGLTREQYVVTLQRMYGAVHAWDTWSTQHVPPHLTALLAGRQRSSLIEHDLGALHADIPGNMTTEGLPEVSASDADFLGRMYVMEGSSLGGQYIARHVEETLGLTPGHGDAYFRGYGEQTSAMWKAFKAVLAELPDEQTETVVRAAKEMFAFFGTHMTQETLQDA